MVNQQDEELINKIIQLLENQKKRTALFEEALSRCGSPYSFVEQFSLAAFQLLASVSIDPHEYINDYVFGNPPCENNWPKNKTIPISPSESIHELFKSFERPKDFLTEEVFTELLSLIAKQEEVENDLSGAIKQFANSISIVIEDGYLSAFITLFEGLYDKHNYLSWWLFEAERNGTVYYDDMEVKLDSVRSFYRFLSDNFEANK